jgi:hypothetical protein
MIGSLMLRMFFCCYGIFVSGHQFISLTLVDGNFFFFSGLNHATDEVKRKNHKWQNVIRPFITFILIAG